MEVPVQVLVNQTPPQSRSTVVPVAQEAEHPIRNRVVEGPIPSRHPNPTALKGQLPLVRSTDSGCCTTFPVLGQSTTTAIRHFELSRPTFSSAFAPANASACAERNLSALFRRLAFRRSLASASQISRIRPAAFPGVFSKT